MTVTAAAPGSSTSSGAPHGLGPLLGVTRGHRWHVLPVSMRLRTCLGDPVWEQRAAGPRLCPTTSSWGGSASEGTANGSREEKGEGKPRLKEAMAATTVTDSSGVRIITEVIPATDPRAAQLVSGSKPSAPAVSFQVRGFRKAQPKALGTIHIFTGIIHICFGIILTVSEYETPSLPVASGVLFWLGLLVKTCCIVNMGVILGTLVATLIHTTAITRDIPSCETSMPYQLKGEWCFRAENKMLSNGLDSIVVIFCFLEFCVAVAALAFGYNAIKQHNYSPMVL
ncbi:PREDICTED: membrane-spanning 4-domains subfamily A member 15-like [Nipponia nippon]|uniref:membrane-spanning 4-domains subfamily A member 15-like n=1 Tax=Nipponia nippon TaxID=128390 RepID=UPI000510ED9B|nr:PREDICTED: membrane-spanning 4-domains subfamily A member 15-like [Nipponia nippon]